MECFLSIIVVIAALLSGRSPYLKMQVNTTLFLLNHQYKGIFSIFHLICLLYLFFFMYIL
jgi:hypothetical protein